MTICFEGKSMTNPFTGQLDIYAEVTSPNGEVDIDALKNAAETVAKEMESYLDGDETLDEEYDGAESWSYVEVIDRITEKLGYSYEIVTDELGGNPAIIADSAEDPYDVIAGLDVKATIEI